MLIRLGCDEMPLAAAAIFFCIVSSRRLARAAARWPPFGFFHPGVADLKANTVVSAHLLWAGAGIASSFRQTRAVRRSNEVHLAVHGCCPELQGLLEGALAAEERILRSAGDCRGLEGSPSTV